MKTIHVTLLLVFFLLLTGCTKDTSEQDADQTFNETFGGQPFKGTAIGIRSQNGADDYTWKGEGRVALIEATADSVSMVFMADFGDLGEMNFKVRGKYDQSTYRMDTTDPNIFFRIIDEKITGTLNNAQQEMSFQGTLRNETASMVMRVNFKEENGPFPKGSSLKLSFDTRRSIDNNDNGQGCQMRLVPIWSPSGVTMGMVPDC
ncbi:hypothetical protein GEO21_04325 [Sphingobacterium faecium]|uniref:hypothetical protein n=1 Tax=Sphingobacterium faecium TaxID=34087 RepID=UPI0012915928|nr:hypothetical protein [Sphingobacterium faecium]MQP26745.1 hypothetical protein [Sphingobacterium faecium]